MKFTIIKFRWDHARANTEGIKTCTTRMTKKGEPGECFFCEGICYRLTRVEQMPFFKALDWWQDEGYRNLSAMGADLTNIYGRDLMVAKVWVHHYEKWYPTITFRQEEALDALALVLEELATMIPESKRARATMLLENYVQAYEEATMCPVKRFPVIHLNVCKDWRARE